MYIDSDTKSFLIHVLNEQTPGGGVGGSQWQPGMTMAPGWASEIINYNPKNAQDTSLLDNPILKFATTDYTDAEQKPGESEEEYQQRIGNKISNDFKSSLNYATGTDLEGMSDDKPSLEYLAGLGILKRSLGYPTNPEAGSELMDFGPARDKSGDVDWTRTAVKPAARALSYGLAKAALNTGMGDLGKKLSGKINYLVALGVDPFDYATKVIGVDYAADQLAKMPKRQKKQITAGQGYIDL
jgi:hypothetical protein